MQVLIIEDEPLAAERLQMLLQDYDSTIEVVNQLASISEAIQWLQLHKHPDLIFADIQLSDGFSFEIFKQVPLTTPIIFTTAYDHYALDAFSLYSIDYLLKPIEASQLHQAIKKYQTLCRPITQYKADQLLKNMEQPKYKSRFLARAGTKMFFVETSYISYFFAEGKMVYLVDKEGNKLMIEYSLDRLEKILDPKDFFRLNRSHLVHYGSILHLKPYINSRYKVLLRNGHKNEEVLMSRERSAEFKEWANVC